MSWPCTASSNRIATHFAFNPFSHESEPYVIMQPTVSFAQRLISFRRKYTRYGKTLCEIQHVGQHKCQQDVVAAQQPTVIPCHPPTYRQRSASPDPLWPAPWTVVCGAGDGRKAGASEVKVAGPDCVDTTNNFQICVLSETCRRTPSLNPSHPHAKPMSQNGNVRRQSAAVGAIACHGQRT